MSYLAVDLYKHSQWSCRLPCRFGSYWPSVCLCVKPAGVNPCWGHVAFFSASLSLKCELFLCVWSAFFSVAYTQPVWSHSLQSQQFIYMFVVQDSRRVFCHALTCDLPDQFVRFINLFLSNSEAFIRRLGMKCFRLNWGVVVLTACPWCRLCQTITYRVWEIGTGNLI